MTRPETLLADVVAAAAGDVDGPTVGGALRALAVLVVVVAVGRLGRPVVRRLLQALGRTPSYCRVFSRLFAALCYSIGALVAVTLAFPSVNPVDALASLGVLSIAAGFAFQDILSNLLAGLLLLLREPFRGGDLVTVADRTGHVVEINLRETVLRDLSGRRLHIPNSTVYANTVEIQTAYDETRSEAVVGVAYESDLASAREVALDALRGVPGLLAAPPPRVLVDELNVSTVDLRLLWWSSSQQGEMMAVRDRAISAVKAAFDAHGIEMPADITVLQAAPSLRAALSGEAEVTPGGGVRRGGQGPGADGGGDDGGPGTVVGWRRS